MSEAQLVEADAPVGLGTTADFAILAGETVTNTGPTVIGGRSGGTVGVSPGTSATGFPPGTISDGIVNANDAVAIQAQIDMVTAYNDAAGRIVTSNLTDQDLAGMTLTTAVYSFDSSDGGQRFGVIQNTQKNELIQFLRIVRIIEFSRKNTPLAVQVGC